jgi:hypothetical protein
VDQYVASSEVISPSTLTCLGALSGAEGESRHLGLLMVVNSAIVGLVATVVFAAVEIATHVLA